MRSKAPDPWKLFIPRPGKQYAHAREFWNMAMQRCGGRCEADTGKGRCEGVAVDVVEVRNGVTCLAYCKQCRLMAFGLSPGERAARSKRFKAAQVPLPGTQQEKKTYG